MIPVSCVVCILLGFFIGHHKHLQCCPASFFPHLCSGEPTRRGQRALPQTWSWMHSIAWCGSTMFYLSLSQSVPFLWMDTWAISRIFMLKPDTLRIPYMLPSTWNCGFRDSHIVALFKFCGHCRLAVQQWNTNIHFYQPAPLQLGDISVLFSGRKWVGKEKLAPSSSVGVMYIHSAGKS